MPPWLAELRATLARNRRRREVQIATASAERGPTVRTVILRRVEEDGTLVFFTDTRSEKVAQLGEDERIEVHGWWTKGRVQFRLRGRAQISVAPEDGLRAELWSSLHEDDLARFHGPGPGRPANAAEAEAEAAAPEAPGERSASTPLDGPAESFALVRVRPTRVDVLRLDPAGHTRDLYELREGAWQLRALEP